MATDDDVVEIDLYRLDTFPIVGLTSMFVQNMACIAMARRLKQRRPEIVTIMGGANCEAPMGSVLAAPLSKALSDAVGLPILGAPLSFTFSLGGIVIWLALVLALSAIASYLPARNASRLTVRETLAYE